MTINPEISKLILRVSLGGFFAFQGMQRLFGVFGGGGIKWFSTKLAVISIPYPELSAYLISFAEFFCGFTLLAGFYVRWSVIPLAIVTALTITIKMGSGIFKFASQVASQGVEYDVVLAAVLAAVWISATKK